MSTSFYILIKEYCESPHLLSFSYINNYQELKHSDDFIAEFMSYVDIADFFRYEKCDRFYDSDNIEGALYPYICLAEEYKSQNDEYPDVPNFVRTVLNSLGFIDYKDQKGSSSVPYRLNGVNVTDTCLGEMARSKQAGNAVVLFNCDAISVHLVLTSSTSESITIDNCKDIPSLHAWFSENRQPPRILVDNPKHGDSSRRSHIIPRTGRRAAQLMTNKAETENFLKLAIGKDCGSSLWYKDAEHGNFIYFENQNEMRLAFHGYHISEGEENFDNIDLDKLKKLGY